MKCRRHQDRHGWSSSLRLSTKSCLLATALCVVVAAGCSGPWRLVDLSHSEQNSQPSDILAAEDEFAETGPQLFPDDADADQDAVRIATDLSSDYDAGSVEATAASLQYQEPTPAALSLPGETSDAAAEETFSIDEVLQYAKQHHPLLRARALQIEIARADLVSAGLLPNPELVLKTDTPIHDDNPTSLTTRVMWSIPTGGRIGHKKAVAQTAIQRACIAAEQEMDNMLTSVAELALHVLYLQELVDEYGRLDRDFKEEVEVQRSRFNDAGTASHADVFETFLDASGYELAHMQTRRELTAVRMRMCRAMGMSTPVAIRIDGKLAVEPVPRVPVQAVLDECRRSDLEIVARRLAVVQSKHELALSYSKAKPSLELGWWYESQPHDPDDKIGGRIDLELPFFDRNQGSISGNVLQIGVNRALAEVSEANTLNDVASAYLELLHVQDSLERSESFQVESKGFDFGTTREQMVAQGVGANQVLDLLRKLSVMKVKALNLRYQHNLLRTRLEFAIGRNLEELLPQAEGPHNM